MQRIKHPYAITMVVCCIFLGLSVFFVDYMMVKNEKLNVKYLYDVNSQSKKTITKQVQGDLQTLSGIATCIGEMREMDIDYLLPVIEKINNDNTFIRMGIIDLQGIVDFADINGEIYRNVDLSQETFFQRALAGESVVSNTEKDRIAEIYVNYYGVPIRKDGKIVAVLCAVNSASILRSIIDTSVFGGEGFSHIVKQNGDYVIRSMHAEVDNKTLRIQDMGDIETSALQKVLDDVAKQKKGFFSYKQQGNVRWAVYAPVGINGWSVITTVSQSAIERNYNDMVSGIITIIVAALLVFTFLFFQMRAMSAKSRKALEYLAYTDKLTGYSNYDKFLADAEVLLARENHKRYAFWYCDLKRFKYFNDLFGYKQGDSILRYLADKLMETLPDDEIFCRMFADNYVGLMFYQDKAEITARFDKLVEMMENFESAKKYGYRVEVSVGAYCYDQTDGVLSVDEMLNRANMAQKSVKLISGSKCAFYSNSMHSVIVKETEIEAKMRGALANEEFEIYLQPKVDIQHGNRIVGAEVLARWNCSKSGMITPGEFIPIFERNGFIVQLDRYMFENACKWIRKTLDAGKERLKISVNVSRIGLMQEDFLEFYIGIKERYRIPNAILELEFTESMVLDNNEVFQSTIIALKQSGFACSLDDFGAGYSSLNVLKDLPIDVLKLDMLFFRKGVNSEKERIVIRNIVAMAKELRMRIVSEGVEQKEQVEFLKSIGCDVVQGYVFARPMPIGDFEGLVQKSTEGLVL